MADTTERVTVIIPVYNDPKGIRQTLQTITAQSGVTPEILVVDNGSDDNTRDVIREFETEYGEISLLSEDDVQGSYATRNEGVEHATGDILAFLDADETVDNTWLRTALKAMDEQNVDYLGCNVKLTSGDDGFIGRYNARTGFPVESYLEEENYAPTCALLVRREVIENVGRFDSRLISGGDIEFGHRVAAAGYDQGYAADAVVTHPARDSFESLEKKNVRVGRGFCQKQRYYPDRYGRPGVPPKPRGTGRSDDEKSEPFAAHVAFTALSLAMLTCRGIGYYYEFVFGSERTATSSPSR